MERKTAFAPLITLTILILTLAGPAQAQYGGGTGEPDDPYLIYTPEQMNAIGADPNDWDKHFKLMADINLAQYTGTEFNIIGTGWSDPFTGAFDGNGHAISNFTYVSSAEHYVGLFGCFGGSDAEIKNLGLIDPNVATVGGYNTGSLAGYAGSGKISHCYVERGTVFGYSAVGGLIGYVDWGTVGNCYATATVTAVEGYVGGLVGSSECGIFTHCYATGNVNGGGNVGGLLGDVYSVTIAYCYAAGTVTGKDNTGGLVGAGDYVDLFESFWDIEVSGQTSSYGGKGKTTEQMCTTSTFLFWGACDTKGTWTLDEGGDYPRLSWEDKPGQPLPRIQLSDFLAGTGTEKDPFLIYTPEELNAIGLFPRQWDKHFGLMADIDLSDYTGADFNVIGAINDCPFTGVFDGNGYTIANLHYCSAGATYLGLFGYVDDTNAQINNLGLIDVRIDGGESCYAGALVAYLRRGTMSDCYVNGGTVSGDVRAGGLVGKNSAIITNCYSSCRVACDNYVDGLVWSTRESDMERSVKFRLRPRYYAGGLVGQNSGTVRNCYSTGTVTGGEFAGGLIGSGSSNVIASFWDVEASGQIESPCGTGKTTAEMQTIETFLEAGWDFVGETENGDEEIWWIDEGRDYPRLWWESADAEF